MHIEANLWRKSKRWKWSSIDVAGSASFVFLRIYGCGVVSGSPWLFQRTDVDTIVWSRVHAGRSSAAAGGTFRCIWGQFQLENWIDFRAKNSFTARERETSRFAVECTVQLGHKYPPSIHRASTAASEWTSSQMEKNSESQWTWWSQNRLFLVRSLWKPQVYRICPHIFGCW